LTLTPLYVRLIGDKVRGEMAFIIVNLELFLAGNIKKCPIYIAKKIKTEKEDKRR